MVEKRKAYIAAIVYAFIIGFSFMFVKITLTFSSPFDTLAHRFTIAWMVATVFVIGVVGTNYFGVRRTHNEKI